MDLMKFVSEQTVILIPVMYVLGSMLKMNKKIPDWTIPWLLLLTSIGLSFGIMGITIQALIQGIIIVGFCILGNQLIKQTVEGFTGSTPTTPKEIKPDGEITEMR